MTVTTGIFAALMAAPTIASPTSRSLPRVRDMSQRSPRGTRVILAHATPLQCVSHRKVWPCASVGGDLSQTERNLTPWSSAQSHPLVTPHPVGSSCLEPPHAPLMLKETLCVDACQAWCLNLTQSLGVGLSVMWILIVMENTFVTNRGVLRDLTHAYQTHVARGHCLSTREVNVAVSVLWAG